MNNYYTYILLNGQYTNINNQKDIRSLKLIKAHILPYNLYILEENESGIILVNYYNIENDKNSIEDIKNRKGTIYFDVAIKYFDGTLIKEYHFK